MKSRATAIVSALLIPLAACGQDQNNQGNQLAAAEPTQSASPTPSERMLAAAEPFEKLTETAFDAPLPQIDATVVEANGAADTIRGLLAPAAAKTMDGLLADIARHRAAGDRADISLASIEIYRLIVTAVPVGAKVPSEVSLLDYAGFRYQADLKATPIRWSDMAEALRFAREKWALVKPQITSLQLTTAFEAALADMERAVKARDATVAGSAAATELDLVDKLEGYFSGPGV